MSNPGWEQIRAGAGLIVWSKLAKWDTASLRFGAAAEEEFEVSASGHKEVHPEFGRLICWIVFGVGSEYLAKGVCLLNGKDPSNGKNVLRPPFQGENIGEWVQMALNRNQDSAILETITTFGDLNKINKLLRTILKPAGEEGDFVYAGIDLLRDSIRNRDAHQYARNVRAFHFHVVHDLFVPALNILLATLDQEDLRRSLKPWGKHSPQRLL